MKLSIFTTYTNPEERGDPWKEALSCYESIADEIIVTGSNWPYEFKWEQIGKTFQEGLEKSTGDWSLRMDIDYFIHEKDFKKLNYLLIKYKNFPVVSFPQYQFFTSNRFDVKTRLCIAVNKKFKQDIKLNGGGDLCLVTFKNKLVDPKKVPSMEIPIYQYDSMFRTKDMIAKDRSRFARAWHKQFRTFGDRGGPDNKSAYEAWYEDIKRKYPRHINKIDFKKHPRFIKDKLLNLDKEQFGYDAFGLKENWKFNTSLYIKGKKEKFINGKLINFNLDETLQI